MTVFRCLILQLSLVGLTLLVGCAAPQSSAPGRVAETPLAPGMTRITVERSSELMYAALSARVRVNGEDFGSLSRGDRKSIDLRPGRVNIAVDTLTAPGRFVMSFESSVNNEYVLKVSPRSGSLLPGLAAGYVGLFVDTAVNEQSGLFQVIQERVTQK